MAKSIAKISGVALRPGISRNNRQYTKEAIASAVQRAQARIAEGKQPLTMLSHHDAADDSTRIVGSIRSLSLDPDGAARYTADIADTDHGRTIASLIDPTGGAAHLAGVSIRGAWAAPVQRKVIDGQTVEYADDLELAGLDFTANPGVAGAGVDSFSRTSSGKPRETADGRTLIFESVVEANIITEDAPAESAPTESAPTAFADPGYCADKAKRYPLDTPGQARTAWVELQESAATAGYTAPQVKRIRERVQKALVRHGATISPEKWLVTRGPVTEMDAWPDRPGSLMVQLDNGMFTVTISSCQVDPADLELCATAAMNGACAAYREMDGDQDGDIDAPDGSEAKPDDNAMESVQVVVTGEVATQADLVSSIAAGLRAADGMRRNSTSSPSETAPASDTPAVPTEMESGMAETSPAAPAETQAAPVETAPETVAPVNIAAPVVTFSADQFTQLLGALAPRELATAGAPAEAAPAAAAPVAEAAPVAAVAAVVTESADEKVARLIAEGIKAALPAAVQEHVEANGPQRKGLVQEHSTPLAAAGSDEHPEWWPRDDKGAPKATLTDQELYAVSNQHLPSVIYGLRGRSA